ncbi:hypothetical protein [Phyllobacterium sp. OV277]|uniref:hypothetical protein n=1 Tax=Phyllobacterium sp. OV277 TaxID=1882772 RepID=UPI00087E8982|nr:hypothetical protein [Phyllobacterium sp. OV277]SDP31516.1 hypothetical protein SAMN05443582_104192 [Phyllobacterium sp. OV277]
MYNGMSRGIAKMILGLFLGLAAHSAMAQEVVTIPSYTPTIGAISTFRTEKSIETDMSIWLEKPSSIMRGDFLQQMMVVSKDEQAVRMRWSLSSDVPAKATGNYDLNSQYKTTLDLYGVEQLEFETDLNGFPFSLIGFDSIRQNMQDKIASSFGNRPVPEGSVLSSLVKKLDNNPSVLTDILVPEAGLLARGQWYKSASLKVGDQWQASRDDDINGTAVNIVTTSLLESVDHSTQTAVITWDEISDKEALTKASQPGIDAMIAASKERAAKLTTDQLAVIKSASSRRLGRSVVSLVDGSTIEVTETLTTQLGGLKTTTVTHVKREDGISSDLAAKSPRNPVSGAIQPVSPNWQNASNLEQTLKELKSNDKDTQGKQAGVEQLLGSATVPAKPDKILLTTLPEKVKYSEPVALKISSAAVMKSPISYGYELKIILQPESSALFGAFTKAAIGQKTQLRIDGETISEPVVMSPIVDGTVQISGDDKDTLDAMARHLLSPDAHIEVQAIPEALPLQVENATASKLDSGGVAVNIVLTPQSAALYKDFTRQAVGRAIELRVNSQVMGSMVLKDENATGKIQLTDGSSTQEQSEYFASLLPDATVEVIVIIKPPTQ